eukprot:5273197-Alexandrium_andersonii.AAC.1
MRNYVCVHWASQLQWHGRAGIVPCSVTGLYRTTSAHRLRFDRQLFTRATPRAQSILQQTDSEE